MARHRDPRLDITYWSREEPFGWKYRCRKYRQSHGKRNTNAIQTFQIVIAIVKIETSKHIKVWFEEAYPPRVTYIRHSI